MTADPIRVVFIDRDPPSGFMAVDRDCLAASCEVERLVYPGRPSISWIRATFRAVRRNDVVYAFFASEHALVPAIAARLLRRGFVLIPAGYDYANVTERRYGLAARRRGWLPKLVGRLAHVALPISRQTRFEFLALVPTAAPRTELAYLAVDPDRWGDPGVERDPDLVVTLAYVDEESWSRKGIDRFVEAARNDPDRRYVVAGRVDPAAEHLFANPPANLERTGPLGHDELRQLFWRAAVYAQLSWHETFGVAMAEAMLCGCVPAIRPSPALREVAGSWARVVEGDDDVAAISAAAAASRDHAVQAVRRDLGERFSLARRTEVLGRAVRTAARSVR